MWWVGEEVSAKYNQNILVSEFQTKKYPLARFVQFISIISVW